MPYWRRSQFSANFELVVEYDFSDRRYEDLIRPVWQQSGRLLRVQAQFNF